MDDCKPRHSGSTVASMPGELLLVICGAGPLKDVTTLISQVLARGWNVQAMATPSAVVIGFDVEAVKKQTGRLVVTSPAVRRITLSPDVILVAPATANTITKLALDIRDTYASSVLGQAVAARTPVVILPSIKKVDLEREVFRNYIKSLRREGVCLLIGGPNGIHPTNASTKDGPVPPFPWHLAMPAIAACIDAHERDTSVLQMKIVSPWTAVVLTTAILILTGYWKCGAKFKET
ncbi:hypothetical protein GGX14DRAFT_594400 [Mycena pura]|uniref:Flavoprotein domain-containing protein n=1 Tax=Mycena pura TaxID=153505 RepID=A0AAD6Y3G0_9AGAR|nr:hypothetical protein GGX14DRAFT_594400 [Mycena pura]